LTKDRIDVNHLTLEEHCLAGTAGRWGLML
jgi:hypothetical protein